jgi:hypothetical protein
VQRAQELEHSNNLIEL